MSNYYPFKCKKGRETEWLVVPAHAQYYVYMLHLSHMQSRFENSNNCLYYQVITSCLKGNSFFATVAWSRRTFAKFRKCTQLFFARFCHICYLVSQVFTAKMSWVRHLILKGGGANNFCQKRQSCKSNNRATRLTFADKKPSCLRSCTFYRNLGNAASHW